MVRPCAAGGKTWGSLGSAVFGLHIDVEYVAAAGPSALRALDGASAWGVRGDGWAAWKPPALRFLTSALRALDPAKARAHPKALPACALTLARLPETGGPD